MKKLILSIIIITAALTAYAADEAGKITSYTGRVLLYDNASPRPANVKASDTPVFMNNQIMTKRKSDAVVSMANGDVVALAADSVMTLDGPDKYKPGLGKVVFHIKKRGQASGVKVALKSAVIGVKGTRFLVETDKNGKNNIYLKDGAIEVDAVKGEFKKYKEVVIDEYEAYIKKMMGEYDDYLKKLQDEYVEYVKSFVMKPGTAYSIDGQEVRKVEFTDDVNKMFDMVK